MSTEQSAFDDDMPAGIDYSEGVRGKFYRPDACLHLPVYLDNQVERRLMALADAKGVELSAVVNDLLRKDIELFEMSR